MTFSKVVYLASTIAMLCSTSALADNEKSVRFKMQSGYATSLPILGEVVSQLPKQIETLSNKSIRIQ